MKALLLLLVVLAGFSTWAAARPLTVMSYNLRYDTASDGVNQWANRRDRVADLIRRHDPDVIGVQEALKSQLDDLRSRLSEYEIYGVGRDDGRERGEFSAVLVRRTRFTVSDSATFWLSDTPEVAGSKGWDAALPRIVTWVRLRDREGGGEFILFNTHFDHRGVEARIRSAGLLRTRVAARRAAEGLPVLVSGDFNFEPTSAGYRALLEGGLLTDARPPGDHRPTALGFEASSQRTSIIDHLFHTAEFRVTRFDVIAEHNGTHFPSDHLPVLAAFERVERR